jgi:hypothetical protein
MKQPETVFKERVQRQLKELFPDAWFFKSSERSLRGIPDIIGVIRGRFVALELKVGHNKPDALQTYVLNRIKKAGGYAKAVWPRNLEETLKELGAL